MRGTQPVGDSSDRFFGIIPAYAGNTAKNRNFEWPIGDHPRVCGEHDTPCRFDLGDVGSSPRMRGTLLFLSRAGSVFGIIPAYAGNTNLPTAPWQSTGDHPRVCGEHS